MTYRTIFKWLPNTLIFILALTFVVSAFDGIVLSAIIAKLADFDASSTFNEVLTYALISFFAMAAVYTATYFKQRVQNKAIRILNTTLKSQFIEKNVYQSGLTEDTSIYISTLLNDFKLLETNYFTILFDTIFYTMMGIFSAVYILWLSVPIGILFILFAFLPMVSPKLFGKKITFASQNWSTNSERFVQKVNDTFNGLNIVKTYQAEPEITNDTENQLVTTEESYEHLNNSQVLAQWVSWILSTISYIAPIFVGLLLVIQNEVEASVIIGIFMASDRVVGPFRAVSGNLNTMQTTSDIRQRIRKNLQEQEEIKVFIQYPLETPKIEFKNTSFAYNQNTPILDNVNMTIDFGRKVLITGKSGSGKTTILNLLQGIIEPSSGKIQFTDKNNKLVNQEIIKTNTMARIQQEPFIFYDDLKFNLTMGKKYSDEECLEVLDQVGLIDELGEDCLQKTYGESGKDLSGGQKQRVEIARALLHNKSVLLVDEATSALDGKAAKTVRDILWNLPGTVIEIAHHYNDEDLEQHNINHYHLENKSLVLIK